MLHLPLLPRQFPQAPLFPKFPFSVKINLMNVLDFIRPTLEDFFRFAKEVDKDFIYYTEREELYEGLKKAQELKERHQEPLKKLYCEWVEKSFRFLINRRLCFEKPPKNSFLHASGLKNATKISLRLSALPMKVVKGLTAEEEQEWEESLAEEEQEWKDEEGLTEEKQKWKDEKGSTKEKQERKNEKGLTEEEQELIKYIVENLNELYVYGFVDELVILSYFRGDCGGKGIIIPPYVAVEILKIDSFHLLYIDNLWVIPKVLRLRYLYDKFFDEVHATFSRILSKCLSKAIQKGRPEKHIRVIQTAIAVIKNDPKGLPEGEPQSFVEKWLREELRV